MDFIFAVIIGMCVAEIIKSFLDSIGSDHR